MTESRFSVYKGEEEIMCGGSPLFYCFCFLFVFCFVVVLVVGEIHRVELMLILRSPLSEPV